MSPELAYGDWSQYLVPLPKCPNCLASFDWDEDETRFDNMRHWRLTGPRYGIAAVNGVEYGEWTCEEAPEADRIAAGYLMVVQLTDRGSVDAGSEGAKT